MLLLLAGFFYVAIYTSWLSTGLVRHVLQQRLPEWQIQSCLISRQQLVSPSQMDFQDIQLILRKSSDAITLNIEKIFCKDFIHFFKEGDPMSFEIQGLDFGMGNNHVHHSNATVSLAFQQRKLKELMGRLNVPELDVAAYSLKNIGSDFYGRDGQIQFDNVAADFYGGQVRGHILLAYQENFPYSIDLEFTRVDLKRLQEETQADSAQVEGKAKGFLRAAGDRRQLRSLETDINIIEGATIRAALLDFIAQYIPPSRQRNEFASLVKKDGKLPLETATVHFQNVNPRKLSGLMRIYSRKLNVNLNPTIDINTDGELSELFSLKAKDLILLIFQNLKN